MFYNQPCLISCWEQTNLLASYESTQRERDYTIITIQVFPNTNITESIHWSSFYFLNLLLNFKYDDLKSWQGRDLCSLKAV